MAFRKSRNEKRGRENSPHDRQPITHNDEGDGGLQKLDGASPEKGGNRERLCPDMHRRPGNHERCPIVIIKTVMSEVLLPGR